MAGMIWAASRLSWASWATAVASKPWIRTSCAPKMLSTNRQATVRKRIRRRGLLAEEPPRAAVLRRPEPPPLPPRRRVGLAGRRAAGPVRALVGRLPPAARPPAGRGVPERAPEGRVPLGRAPEGRPAPRAGCPGADRPPVPVDAVGAPPPRGPPSSRSPPCRRWPWASRVRRGASRRGCEPGPSPVARGPRAVASCAGSRGAPSVSCRGVRAVGSVGGAGSATGGLVTPWPVVAVDFGVGFAAGVRPPRACSASLPGCWRRARELSPQGCSSSGPWTR